jgi:hypothetical protein
MTVITDTTPAETRLPSNRRFGSFFTLVFLAACGYAAVRQELLLAGVLLLISVATAAMTFTAPQLLSPFNRLWHGLGMALGRVTGPLVLGVIYFLLLTPVALVTRMLGRDSLALKRKNMASYWVDRIPSGPPPQSFRNQY